MDTERFLKLAFSLGIIRMPVIEAW